MQNRTATRKIFGPTRIDTPDTSGVTCAIEPSSGGATCKNVVYFVKTVSESGSPWLELSLEHGPDGVASCSHSTPIASKLSGGAGTVIGGSTNADSSGQLGEWLHPKVEITTTAGTAYAIIEVFELRKPF